MVEQTTDREADGEEQGEKTARATVKVWTAPRHANWDDVVDGEPDEFEMEVFPAEARRVLHERHTILCDEMENHSRYAFDVETSCPVDLYVETNDSYHEPQEGFLHGWAIEGGLSYVPESHEHHGDEPYKCELWGRIRMRLQESDTQ